MKTAPKTSVLATVVRPHATTTRTTPKIRQRTTLTAACSQCKQRNGDAELVTCKHCKTSNICEQCDCNCSLLARIVRAARPLRLSVAESKVKVLRLEATAKKRPLSQSEKDTLKEETATVEKRQKLLNRMAVKLGLA